jgi:Mn2+/Fe2+ NRAMP family transporter
VVHRGGVRGDAVDAWDAEHQVPSDAAQAMRPLAGDFAYILFAAGLFNASFFAASILPISTAYSVCEGLGFESGVDKKFSQAPFFYWLYTRC